MIPEKVIIHIKSRFPVEKVLDKYMLKAEFQFKKKCWVNTY